MSDTLRDSLCDPADEDGSPHCWAFIEGAGLEYKKPVPGHSSFRPHLCPQSYLYFPCEAITPDSVTIKVITLEPVFPFHPCPSTRPSLTDCRGHSFRPDASERLCFGLFVGIIGVWPWSSHAHLETPCPRLGPFPRNSSRLTESTFFPSPWVPIMGCSGRHSRSQEPCRSRVW